MTLFTEAHTLKLFFSPMSWLHSALWCVFYRDAVKLATCLLLWHHCVPSPQFIYRPQLTGKEKIAPAGFRRVMESCREVNDGLAVIPEAELEVGHTHTHLYAVDHTRTVRGVCQGSEWCTLPWMFLTRLSSQGKQGRTGWLQTDIWIWADEPANTVYSADEYQWMSVYLWQNRNHLVGYTVLLYTHSPRRST